MHASFCFIYYAQKHLLNLTCRLSCKYFANPNAVPQFYSTPQRTIHFTNNHFTNNHLKNTIYSGDISDGGSKEKGKVRSIWVCESCGYSDAQWGFACPSCSSDGKMERFVKEGKTTATTWLEPLLGGDAAGPVRLIDVNKGVDQKEWLIPLPGLFGDEVARVLGGGLVPGSLVLVGGDPGVGKSTLLLQIAALIAQGNEKRRSAPVVYISGEESVEQIKNRADRMTIRTEELFLYTSTDVEDILKKAGALFPRALIVDSIQTVYLKGVTGSPGGVSQVKRCTLALDGFAKKTNIPVFLIGHVNKSGSVAGPRGLEHIVDAVLYLEGEKHSSPRFLRPVKNRFGSTDELGVFEMSQSGLQAVLNPSEIFLNKLQTDSEVSAGLAVAVIMDGSRSYLIEIQASCEPVNGNCSKNLVQVNGYNKSRASMIILVIKRVGLIRLQEHAICLNVVSGLTLKGTACDLAVAAAICSSLLEFSIPPGVAFIAEVGLFGELRKVPDMEKRVITVAKLGYKVCVVPSSAVKFLSDFANGMKILGCLDLKEMIMQVFRQQGN